MIGLFVDNHVFENDIRALMMAFYPGQEIKCCYEGQAERLDEREFAIRLHQQIKMVGDQAFLGLEIWDKDQGTHSVKDEEPIDLSDRKEAKTVAKCMQYRLLAELTGRELPWGTQTGIRPTKIVRQLLDDGESEAAAYDYMRNVMLCGEAKTNLSLEIAKRERELLSQLSSDNGYSLYIGIPFCPTTCAYCSFTSYPIRQYADRVDAYLDALEREISFAAEHFANRPLDTVYFGGGTPTAISAEQLDRLLTMVESAFDLRNMKEMTVEAGRPDSITREKLEAIKKHRVTRISINPQTMKDETLKLIGRRHSVLQTEEAYQLAREIGFDNINMDIIIGLPEETMDDVEHTLASIRDLRPDNLTVHTLAIKRAARLNTEKDSWANTKSINSDAVMDMTQEYARAMGMEPYYLYRQKNMTGNMENVGYALPGKEGLYNILIMEEIQDIVALGAGGVSKAIFGDRIERAENVKDVKTYLERVDEMIERKRQLFKKRS